MVRLPPSDELTDEPAEVDAAIRHSGLLALIRCRTTIDTLLEVGDALLASPLTAVAITPGSREPWTAVVELRARYGHNMLIGAGPLCTPAQIAAAIAAGSQFVLASRFEGRALEFCRTHGVFYLPGVTGPADAIVASAAGCSLLSLFPAGRPQRLQGPARLAALRQQTPAGLIPIGGVDLDTIGAYARAGAAAGGVRGVLPPSLRWQMARMIRQVRVLRREWVTASRGQETGEQGIVTCHRSS